MNDKPTKEDSMFKFQLGVRVKDMVSGFEGIVTGNLVYLNGCKQALVRPKIKADEPTKFPDGTWMDEQNLEQVDAGIVKAYRKSNAKLIAASVGSDTPAPTSPSHG